MQSQVIQIALSNLNSLSWIHYLFLLTVFSIVPIPPFQSMWSHNISSFVSLQGHKDVSSNLSNITLYLYDSWEKIFTILTPKFLTCKIVPLLWNICNGLIGIHTYECVICNTHTLICVAQGLPENQHSIYDNSLNDNYSD